MPRAQVRGSQSPGTFSLRIRIYAKREAPNQALIKGFGTIRSPQGTSWEADPKLEDPGQPDSYSRGFRNSSRASEEITQARTVPKWRSLSRAGSSGPGCLLDHRAGVEGDGELSRPVWAPSPPEVFQNH